MNSRRVNVAIVGAGPAGLAAAIAAVKFSDSVALIDDNAEVGGQIWRAEMGRRAPNVVSLLNNARESGLEVLAGSQVFDATNERLFCETSDGGALEIEFSKLTIATGARELMLPFPGWTLPGVFGAGGLQALVKGGFDVSGKRIVLGGSGPLLLAVASLLRKKGATVLAIFEQTTAAALRRFGLSMLSSPAKLLQAGRLRASLLSVPYVRDQYIVSVEQQNDVLRVSTQTMNLECDVVGVGYHLIPNLELASLLGCDLKKGTVAVDGYQRTSIANVLAAGEPTGIGGVARSLIEGEIAGYAAAGQLGLARRKFAARRRSHEFARRMETAFRLRDELRAIASAETIVCRCEDVRACELIPFETWRTAKLQTRAGMGPCQGRVCGPAMQFLYGWEPASVRPPLYPVKIENL